MIKGPGHCVACVTQWVHTAMLSIMHRSVT